MRAWKGGRWKVLKQESGSASYYALLRDLAWSYLHSSCSDEQCASQQQERQREAHPPCADHPTGPVAAYKSFLPY